MTWSLEQLAVKVSQLQYSLAISEWKITYFKYPHRTLYQQGSLRHHRFSGCICQTSCVHTLPSSSESPHLVCTVRWTSPSCNILSQYPEYQKLTLLYLQNIQCQKDSQSRHMLWVSIFRTSCVRTLPRWWVPPDQVCTEQGKSPSYSTLWPHLNQKFLLYNILWTTCRVQSLCSWIHGLLIMHLPNLIRPYIADSMTMIWPSLHTALKVSQLQ